MYFSRAGRLAAALISLSLCVSCSLRLGENPDTQLPVSLANEETACLEAGGKTMVDFFQGRANHTQIGAFWDCTERSLILFTERYKGRQTGLYKPEELRGFLKFYFSLEISDRMLREFMILKQTLIGGRTDSVTFTEIDQSRRLLQLLRKHSLLLKPYLPFTPDHFRRAHPRFVAEATEALENAAKDLSQFIRGTGFDYNFANLDALLEEMQRTSSSETAAKIVELRQYLPVYQQFKALLISPNRDTIESREWEHITGISIRWYSVYLRFQNVMSQYKTVLSGEGRIKLVEIINDGFALFKDAIARHPNNTILFTEFDRLIDSIDPEAFQFNIYARPRTLDRQHLKDFLRPLIRKMLAGARAGAEGREANGLTASSLKRVWQIVDGWNQSQAYADMLFEKMVYRVADSEQAQGKYPRTQLLALSIEDVYGRSRDQISDEAWRGAERMISILRDRRLLTYAKPSFGSPRYKEIQEEIFFTPFLDDPLITLHSVSLCNYMDVLSTMLFEAYAKDPVGQAKTGLTFEEVDEFYRDLKPIGVDLRIFDPNDPNVSRKRFTEGDLLTLESNGDSRLSIGESAQLFALLASTKSASIRIHDRIAQVCPGGEEDFFGFQKIDAACYRQWFYGGYGKTWEQIPRLAGYYGDLSDSAKQALQQNLEAMGRKVGYDPTRFFDSTDTDGLMGASQYAENMFLRFDRDKNLVVSVSEAIEGEGRAFNTFDKLLFDLTCKQGLCFNRTNDRIGLFTYLLDKGKIPSGISGLLALSWWGMQKPWWNFKADRGRIIGILGLVGKASKANKANRANRAPIAPQAYAPVEDEGLEKVPDYLIPLLIEQVSGSVEN